MRTTLTIDDTVATDLKDLAHKTDTPFKDVVDKVLRAGLDVLRRPKRSKSYRARTFKMGKPAGFDMDKALELATRLEDEEILRKVALRK